MNTKFDNLLVSISRVVAVVSAGVAIADIDLREGGILIGGGNIGKTSILNAIRLFLLPEENFKGSKKKFGFSDKEGNFYSDDECFEHYFPSHSSFLILECDNYLGGSLPHCQILYRGTAEKLDYRRMFTSLRYEQIRHLFWDQSYGDDGIGGAVQGLTPAKIQAYLKQEDKHFKTKIRSSAIKDLIYANQLLDIDAMRYCLFPLSNTSDAEVDAFRALVRLLFDMKTGSDAVRLAVANIIETQKKERKDALNFDIDDFIDKNDALSQRERTLNLIESLRPQFERLNTQYQELAKNKDAEERLMQFTSLAKLKLDKKNKTLGKQQEKLESLTRQKKVLLDDCRHAENSLQSLDGGKKVLEPEQRRLDEKIKQTEQIIYRYDAEDTLETIIEGLKGHLEEKEQELRQKQDAEQRKKDLIQLEQNIATYEKQEKNYLSSIENKQFKLFNQLPEDAWFKLASINLAIAEANPERELNDTELHVITEFTHLVQQGGDDYQWFNATLKRVSLDQRESDKSLLEHVQEKLLLTRKKAEKLKEVGTLSQLDIIREIKALNREITETKNDIKLIQAFDSNKDRLQQVSLDLTNNANEQKQLKEHIEKKKIQLSELKKALEHQESVCEECEKEVRTLVQCHQKAQTLLSVYELSTNDDSVSLDSNFKIDDETLASLRDNIQFKRSARNEIVEGIQQFVREQVLDNDDQIMASNVDDEHLTHAFGRLQSRYSGLNEEFDVLRKSFIEHNYTIHSIINDLKNNREMIRQFEKSINRAFSGIRINDLEEVEASIQVEGRFEDLVGEIEHLDAHSDQKASEQFIERLRAFSSKFFPDGKARLLTMEQIVSGISYRVKKQRQTRWETKSQSTSTIMLINLKLVEILLGRLKNSACTTHFPLIIDEGASVDSSQFDWLFPNMKQAGFRVLSASTNSASSEIIFKFGQNFRLDSMHTAKPYHVSRTIAYTGMPESFVEQGSSRDREQLDMFGEGDE